MSCHDLEIGPCVDGSELVQHLTVDSQVLYQMTGLLFPDLHARFTPQRVVARSTTGQWIEWWTHRAALRESGSTVVPADAEALDSRARGGPMKRPSISRLKAGDPDAWAWFFGEFAGQIAGYARRMGATDPEDLTGTVLEAVARGIGAFEGSHGQFRSWVFSIAHARIVDDHRRRSRRTEVELTEVHDTDASVAVDELANGDPELEVALASLSDEQRSLLHLRYVVGLSTKEIAKAIDKSEVATRVALHRTSKTLRELLSDDVTEEIGVAS